MGGAKRGPRPRVSPQARHDELVRRLAQMSKDHAEYYADQRPGLLSVAPDDTWDGDWQEQVARTNEAYQSLLARLLRQSLREGKGVPVEYLDFLEDAGLPAGLVEDVRTGRLPMDEASRYERANDIGLNTALPVYRIDEPGKTQFRGRNREGLVYYGFDPRLAKEAAQTGPQQYAGFVSEAGLPQDRDGIRLLRGMLDDAVALRKFDRLRPFQHGFESRVPDKEITMRHAVAKRTPAGYTVQYNFPRRLGDLEKRAYGRVERRQQRYNEALAEPGQGYDHWGDQSGLVNDEAHISGATAKPPYFRSKGLAVFSPDHVMSRNIFYGGLLSGLMQRDEE